MPDVLDVAVTPAKTGAAVAVEVVPGARTSVFPAGTNPWRGTVEARVRAPPEKGEANAELCALVAEALGVAASAVAVTSGATSRRKVVTVTGLDPETVRRRLRTKANA